MRPREPAPGREDTLVIVVHGSMGGYLTGVPRRVAFVLAQHGLAALSINTRMANYGTIYGSGLLDEAPLDVDAALADARALGYTRVVLLGHSLGGVVVVRHQALRGAPEVVGVCTLAQPADLRESLRLRWERFGAEPGIDAVEAMARAAGVDDPEGRDDIVIVRRGSGPGDAPKDAEVWSLRCWWRSRGPEAEAGDARRWVGRIGVPLMLVSAGDDPVVPDHSADVLAAIARDGGVPVEVVHVHDADHSFWDRVPEALERVPEWIDGLGRPTDAASARPAAPPPGPSARLLTVRAPDGVVHDALLHIDADALATRAARDGRRTAIVHLHGNQGNFTVGALRFLHPALAARGVPVLALETRVGNVSQIFGESLQEDAIDDVAGAAELLAELGFDGVVVSGYSLGAVIAVRAAAGVLALPVRGLIGLGTAADLRASTRRLMGGNGARPRYDELVEMARPVAGRPQDDFPLVVRNAYLPGDEPRAAGVYTARTWWHSRGPAALDSQPVRWIPRVGAPALLVQGGADAIVDPGDATRLADAAVDAEVVMVEGATHSFHGHEDEVVTAVASWIDRKV